MEFFEGRDAYFADPEGNYWGGAWGARDNPVTAAARRAAGIATRHPTEVSRGAIDWAPQSRLALHNCPQWPGGSSGVVAQGSGDAGSSGQPRMLMARLRRLAMICGPAALLPNVARSALCP